LVTSSDSREFFVWVNPEDWLVQNNAGLVGIFACGPIPGLEDDASKIMFVPNPDFLAPLSPFQWGMLSHYIADYNLELSRQHYFSGYPSRLDACFLVESAAAGHKYAAAQPEHVKRRTLKRLVTEGSYVYSTHDSGWVDFLRLRGSIDAETINAAARHYWRGDPAIGSFTLLGVEYAFRSAREVLFYGRVRFTNLDLSVSDG
jgi:hypothetical protein